MPDTKYIIETDDGEYAHTHRLTVDDKKHVEMESRIGRDILIEFADSIKEITRDNKRIYPEPCNPKKDAAVNYELQRLKTPEERANRRLAGGRMMVTSATIVLRGVTWADKDAEELHRRLKDHVGIKHAGWSLSGYAKRSA